MIDRAALEVAVQTFVVAVLGPLGVPDVRWADQKDLPEPEGSYATLRLGELVARGQDQVSELTDLTRSAGQEVELQVRGERDLTLTIQCWTTATVANGTAADLLDDLQASLSLPLLRSTLTDAGLYPYDVGPVMNLSALELEGTHFVGRAAMDVHCHLATTISEYTGFIERVQLKDGETGQTYVVQT